MQFFREKLKAGFMRNMDVEGKALDDALDKGEYVYKGEFLR